MPILPSETLLKTKKNPVKNVTPSGNRIWASHNLWFQVQHYPFWTNLLCFHVVKPLLPILALLPFLCISKKLYLISWAFFAIEIWLRFFCLAWNSTKPFRVLIPIRFQWRIQDFPQGGAPTPKSAIIFQFFAENCMKMKEFGLRGGNSNYARPWRPPWIRQWIFFGFAGDHTNHGVRSVCLLYFEHVSLFKVNN